MNNKSTIAIPLLFFATALHAQYKCTSNGGQISFQQSPCNSNAKQQPLNFRTPAQTLAPIEAASKASTPTDMERIKVANSSMEKDRRIREIEYKIGNLEQAISKRNAQMTAETNILRTQKSRASNNLAGATWEQSLSAEMQAVTQKYQALNQIDVENIKALRPELITLQNQK